MDYDYLAKIVIVGDSGVGKSCLLLRFTEETYSEGQSSTIGVDFKTHTIELGGKSIKMQIWDTAGQERFRAIAAPYYRGAHGIIIVYDVTDEKSFSSVGRWIEDAQRLAGNDKTIVIVGNKTDLAGKRAVHGGKARLFSARTGFPLIEASAKDATNVHKIFFAIAADIAAKSVTLSTGISLTVKPTISISSTPIETTAGGSACCGYGNWGILDYLPAGNYTRPYL